MTGLARPCLSEGVCSSLRRDLTGEAQAFFVAHEAELRELTRAEVMALARPFVHIDVERVPAALCVRLSVAWRVTDPDGWRAWRNSTTSALQGVAQRRVEARAMLLEAITQTSGVVLRAVGAALRSRLGL